MFQLNKEDHNTADSEYVEELMILEARMVQLETQINELEREQSDAGKKLNLAGDKTIFFNTG